MLVTKKKNYDFYEQMEYFDDRIRYYTIETNNSWITLPHTF